MPAFLLNPLTWAGIIIAVLSGLLFMEHNNKVAAEKGEKAAQVERNIFSDQADQLKGTRDDALAKLKIANDIIERQNAVNEQLRFAREQADLAAAKAETEARSAREQFDQRVQEIEEEARQNPTGVVQLGPIVLKRVPQLFN